MVMSTQVREYPCIVTSENIASSEVFGHPAPKENVVCDRLL